MLLLIDINMPVMTGIELIRKLRELEVTQNLNLSKSHAIAYTALPANSLGDFKELGFDSYMQKPLKLKRLEKLVKKLRA